MKIRKYNIDFVGKFPFVAIFSGLLIITSLSIIWQKGLNYGVDFKGGAQLQVKFSQDLTSEDVRQALDSAHVQISSVQTIGEKSQNEFLIKLVTEEERENEATEKAVSTLNQLYGDKAEVRKTDIVGPKAGEQLRVSGFLAMLWAILGIMIYIALRFDFRYSPGAIIALFHDVIIILGIFALLDKEFSLQIVGALLAIIGYSVNDTVVVFDRVREYDTGSGLRSIINKGLNETLSRTILTSLTTFMVSGIMFAFGGGVIKDFFFAISIGVIIGTYSSVFVASPMILVFEKLLSGKKNSAKA